MPIKWSDVPVVRMMYDEADGIRNTPVPGTETHVNIWHGDPDKFSWGPYSLVQYRNHDSKEIAEWINLDELAVLAILAHLNITEIPGR